MWNAGALLLASTGCFLFPDDKDGTVDVSQSATCAEYLVCLQAVGSPDVDLAERAYGPTGSCWGGSEEEALGCTSECVTQLAACLAAPPIPPTDSGTDTGTDGCEETFGGPTAVRNVTVQCSPSGSDVTVLATTDGYVLPGGDHEFYFVESGNVPPVGFPRWSEVHPIDSNGNREPCGVSDQLELQLDAGPYPGYDLSDYQPGVSSFFSCDAHFDGSDVLSYALAVEDVNGVFADCLAFGEDPVGLVAGDFPGLNDDQLSFDLDQCRAASGR